MNDYRHVIALAYREILKREPDPGGLEHYNEAMQGPDGMSEAELRNILLRSPEYAERFPGEVTEPPPPPPPPPTGGSMALRVEGPVFRRVSDGQIVRLLGAVSCCADADADAPGTLEYGWPLVNREFLNLLSIYRLNFCHVRLGPMLQKNWDGQDSDGEQNPGVQGYLLRDNKYDLDQWEPRYWTNLRNVIGYARSLGIYVQVDLIDAWVLDHELGPWSAHRNHQGYEGGSLAVMQYSPSAVHEAWIRKCVRETGIFDDNVLYQDGNESFKGGNQMKPWVLGMGGIVKDELSRMGIDPDTRPFGTNSQREEIEAACDYGIYHERSAPDPTTWPRMTNEYGEMSPAAVLEQVRIGWDSGGSVAFHYWRGGHSGKDFLATLDTVRKIVLGQDVPPPIPDECPPLVRWGSKVHNVMSGAFQSVDFNPNDVVAPRGGYVVVDSTPRFGTGRGEPCNDEHPGCGGRKCEDPRGGLWTLDEGDAGLHIQANGFQCRVGPLAPGRYTLRVRPRDDCQDHYGKPVTVTAAAREGTTTSWSVA